MHIKIPNFLSIEECKLIEKVLLEKEQEIHKQGVGHHERVRRSSERYQALACVFHFGRR